MNNSRPTTIDNVRVIHIRPRYNNLREWCQDPNNVYIGRKHIVDNYQYPPQDSLFANPFKVPKGTIDTTPYLIAYENHLRRLLIDPSIFNQFLNLRGKNLGCWCAEYDAAGIRLNPDQCHGDSIVKLLNMI